MKRRNEVKPNAFENIIGKENLGRHNWLLNIALYSEFGLNRKASKEEIKELLAYNSIIEEYILKHYTKTENIGGEDFMINGEYPNIPVSRWNFYQEHINRVKDKYNILIGNIPVQDSKFIDFQI